MEWFQQTATEQHDRVNGHCKPKSPQDTADVRWTPPEGESGGSDSCGGTSVSELTDLQELKARESEDEEDKEEKEVVPPSKGLKGDQKKKEKESPDQDENNHSKQNSSAATSYTGKAFISKSCDLPPGESLEMVHNRFRCQSLIIHAFLIQTCPIPRRPRCQNSCALAEKTAQGLGSAWSVRSVGTRPQASTMVCMPVKVAR